MARNKVQFQKGLSEVQFAVLYGTEDQCREAVMRWRWPSGFVCPVCAGELIRQWPEVRFVRHTISGITRNKLHACDLEDFKAEDCNQGKACVRRWWVNDADIDRRGCRPADCRRMRLCRRAWRRHPAEAGGGDHAAVW